MFQKLKKVQNYLLLYLSLVPGATRLCLCKEYVNDYRSCDHFDDYGLNVLKVSVPYFQSKNAVLEAEEDRQQVDDESDNYWDFLSINSIVAVALDSGSQDSFWLIRIKENNSIASSKDPDSYGNEIVLGQRYFKWHFWKECIATKTSFSINN